VRQFAEPFGHLRPAGQGRTRQSPLLTRQGKGNGLSKTFKLLVAADHRPNSMPSSEGITELSSPTRGVFLRRTGGEGGRSSSRTALIQS
jgi:hypothetical protein